MKLRIRDNSIRLRLGRSETAAAGDGRAVWGTTRIGPSTFRYGFVPDPAAGAIEARFTGGRLTVTAPADEVRTWARGDAVGLSAKVEQDDGSVLRILVEKDFACLAPRPGEDESDAFPHPAAGRTAC